MENVCACVLSWKISSFTSFSVSQVFLHSGGLADYQRWWMIWTLLQTRDNAVSRGGTLFNQGHSAGSSLAGRSFMATSRVRSQSPSQHIFHYQQQKGCWGLGEWQRAIRAPAEQELRRQIQRARLSPRKKVMMVSPSGRGGTRLELTADFVAAFQVCWFHFTYVETLDTWARQPSEYWFQAYIRTLHTVTIN